MIKIGNQDIYLMVGKIMVVPEMNIYGFQIKIFDFLWMMTYGIKTNER